MFIFWYNKVSETIFQSTINMRLWYSLLSLNNFISFQVLSDLCSLQVLEYNRNFFRCRTKLCTFDYCLVMAFWRLTVPYYSNTLLSYSISNSLTLLTLTLLTSEKISLSIQSSQILLSDVNLNWRARGREGGRGWDRESCNISILKFAVGYLSLNLYSDTLNIVNLINIYSK